MGESVRGSGGDSVRGSRGDSVRGSRAGAWLKLVRLPNALVAGLGTWLGHACLPGPLDLPGAWVGSAAMALLAAAGNAHNDLLDLAADRINRPDRPLPSGRISPRTAAWAAGLLYAAAFAAAFTLGPVPGNFVVGMGILLALYNLKLKGLPLLGNLAVALLCALAVYLPELPGPPVHTGIPALFAFLATLARELSKDAEDMPGDRAVGWSTFPIRFGLPATRMAVGTAIAATLLLLPVPAAQLVLGPNGFAVGKGWIRLPVVLDYHPAYGVLAVLGAAPLLAWSLRDIFRKEQDWGRLQRRLKWTMLAGMLAILAGARL